VADASAFEAKQKMTTSTREECWATQLALKTYRSLISGQFFETRISPEEYGLSKDPVLTSQ
jgi:hypothetical protein